MLFTDGLVERRHESIDAGLQRVADVLAEAESLPISAVADTVLAQLAPPAGYDDDVAMVVYRHQLPPLRIETRAAAEELAGIRHRLTAWLHSADLGDERVDDIVLVVSEACSNCVEHAYRGHEVGTMQMEAQAVDGEIRIQVVDSGSWKTPAADPGNSGRGLVLIRAISDSVQLQTTPDGTTVEVSFRC